MDDARNRDLAAREKIIEIHAVLTELLIFKDCGPKKFRKSWKEE